jgi:transcription antitermination protein NusB
MSNRHLSRSVVLQSLFEWDFRKTKEVEALEVFARNAKEFAPDTGDFSFMETLMKGVLEKCSVLNDVISKAAPDWPVEKISIVDRNILRIGLYELLFTDKKEVPPKVAINEAIELAKSFGGTNSGKFVNGVLGAVYKEMGEPGKEQSSRKAGEGDGKNLETETLGGAVIYALDKKEIFLALVHDVFGHWTLSKGKIKKDADEKVATGERIKEELGINIEIEDELGSNEYIAYDPEKGKIKKQVKYFLARSDFSELKLGESGGLDDAQWFRLKDILELNFYDDIMPIITKAISQLASRYQAAESSK